MFQFAISAVEYFSYFYFLKKSSPVLGEVVNVVKSKVIIMFKMNITIPLSLFIALSCANVNAAEKNSSFNDAVAQLDAAKTSQVTANHNLKAAKTEASEASIASENARLAYNAATPGPDRDAAALAGDKAALEAQQAIHAEQLANREAQYAAAMVDKAQKQVNGMNYRMQVQAQQTALMNVDANSTIRQPAEKLPANTPVSVTVDGKTTQTTAGEIAKVNPQAQINVAFNSAFITPTRTANNNSRDSGSQRAGHEGRGADNAHSHAFGGHGYGSDNSRSEGFGGHSQFH